MNYFLGIDATSGRLVADFEDTGIAGLNHPVTGTTVVTQNVWHHAAATYDGTDTWRLYLDGVLDGTLALGGDFTPRPTSIQHAAIGTAMTSTGAAAGFFQGQVDEVRIWNVARSGAQIAASAFRRADQRHRPDRPLRPQRGLGHDRGQLIAGAPNGTTVADPTWVAGFPLADLTPPAAPTGVTATPATARRARLDGERRGRPRGLPRVPRHLAAGPHHRHAARTARAAHRPELHRHHRRQRHRPTTTWSSPPTPPATPRAASADVAATPAAGRRRRAALRRRQRPRHLRQPRRRSAPRPSRSRPGSGAPARASGVTTGTGGIASAIPLVTKGRAEAETPATST